MGENRAEEIKTIDDMLRWKLDASKCRELEIQSISHYSVEKENAGNCAKLGWKQSTDVLYSFLLPYLLGLQIVNGTRFLEIKEQVKDNRKLDRLNNNSPILIYECSKDDTFKDFNERVEWTEFINLYFSIGNVIPIWPGGNEARGKAGIYDIPELFFAEHKVWTDTLVNMYKNAYMDEIIKNDLFFVHHTKEGIRYSIRGSEEVTASKSRLFEMMKDDPQIYFDYLKHRNDLIKYRKERLEAELGYFCNGYNCGEKQ